MFPSSEHLEAGAKLVLAKLPSYLKSVFPRKRLGECSLLRLHMKDSQKISRRKASRMFYLSSKDPVPRLSAGDGFCNIVVKQTYPLSCSPNIQEYFSRAEVIASVVKSWPSKHENLSLIPQTHILK